MKITVLVGIPGSGKSTWVANEYDGDGMVLSSDAIREELYGDEAIQGNPNEVFDELYYRMEECLKQDRDVVIDATSIGKRERYTTIKMAKQYNAKLEAVVFKTPVPVCIRRNDERVRTVPDYAMDHMIRKFEDPTIAEGFDIIRVIRYEDSRE